MRAMGPLRASLILLVGCGAAPHAVGSPITQTTNNASRWEGAFEATTPEGHIHLDAPHGSGGWRATLASYAPWGVCRLSEIPGTRTETTLDAQFTCDHLDRDGDGESLIADGETTITLLANGHLHGSFGLGEMDLTPQRPWPPPLPGQPIAIDDFDGEWGGVALAQGEHVFMRLRGGDGVLTGDGAVVRTDRLDCRFTERPAARAPGRVRLYVDCHSEVGPAHDFARDCTFDLAVDRSRIVASDCFGGPVELTPQEHVCPL
jgi:hypothetical protein